MNADLEAIPPGIEKVDLLGSRFPLGFYESKRFAKTHLRQLELISHCMQIALIDQPIGRDEIQEYLTALSSYYFQLLRQEFICPFILFAFSEIFGRFLENILAQKL